MSQCVVARGSAFALGDFQTFRSTAQVFVDSARRLSPELVAMPPFERLQAAVDHGAPATTEEQHGLVCAFLDGLKEASHRMTSPENYSFVAKCTEYDSYIDKVAREFRANARRLWPKQVKSENNAAIALAIDEIVAHVRGFAASSSPFDNFAAYTQMRLRTLVPPEIAGMRQETNISLILPFFEKSLSVPGDAAEFGCFRGVLSVKLAWMIKAVGVGQRHYYTFDTFGGFEIADPAGGALGVGAFSDNADAYNYLTQWSRVPPADAGPRRRHQDLRGSDQAFELRVARSRHGCADGSRASPDLASLRP